jgi:hypothetical protein
MPGESLRFILVALLLYLTLTLQPRAAQSAIDGEPEANPGGPLFRLRQQSRLWDICNLKLGLCLRISRRSFRRVKA